MAALSPRSLCFLLILLKSTPEKKNDCQRRHDSSAFSLRMSSSSTSSSSPSPPPTPGMHSGVDDSAPSDQLFPLSLNLAIADEASRGARPPRGGGGLYVRLALLLMLAPIGPANPSASSTSPLPLHLLLTSGIPSPPHPPLKLTAASAPLLDRDQQRTN
jgi:hypothetical protein